MPEFRSNLNLGGVAKITGLVDGTSAQDAATLAQLNAAVEGLNWKDAVRVAAQVNVNLASPGASIDGITMVANDRFLAPNQTAGAENGIYIWNGAGVAATRAPDMSVAAEVEQAITTVEEGTNAGSTFRQTAVNVTLGTTTLTWTAFGTGAPSASETTSGIAEFATQGEVDTGTDTTRTVRPSTLAGWAGRPRVKTGNIGDGSATAISVTHNFGTRDVMVELYRNATPWDTVFADITRPDVNTVTFTFGSAPTTNQFSYIIRSGGTV